MFIAISGLAISVLLIFSLNIQKEPAPIPRQVMKNASQEQVEKHLLSIVEKENPRVALTTLKEVMQYNDTALLWCHSLVHSIGHAATKKYGELPRALLYQSELCGSGYVHGVLEAYFAQVPDITVAIKTACSSYKDKSFLGWVCSHGIGHGTMFYTVNDLPKALKLCDSLSTSLARSSCVSGAFMENFLADNSMHPSRYVKDSDPAYPCMEQKKEHKGLCYAYAPVRYLLKRSNDYTGALQFCKSVEKEYQIYCLYGTGNEIANKNIADPKLVENVCMQVQGVERAVCIDGMVNRYITYYGSLQQAREVCNKVRLSNKPVCLASIRKTEGELTF